MKLNEICTQICSQIYEDMRRLVAFAILLFATCGLLMFAANSARADLRDLPTSMQMRCGPADPPVQVTLSAALSEVAKCDMTPDGRGELTQTAALSVNVGANHYEAKVMQYTDQPCADIDVVHVAISDGYSTYTLNVGKSLSSIGDGHAAVCESK